MQTYDVNLRQYISSKLIGEQPNFQSELREKSEDGMVEQLVSWRKRCYSKYLRSLIDPENHICKIPSPLPTESAVATLRFNTSITPNSTGKFLLVVDPFSATGFLYQDAGVNGTGGGTVTNLTFAQDVNLVDAWRLCSASLTLKYYGSFNSMSGLFIGANTNNYSAATQTTFLNFSTIEGLPGKRIYKASEGIKFVYTPLDENSNEYQPQSTYTGIHPCKWQNLWVVYGDQFPNSSCIRLDYVRNIEYQSTVAYKQYVNHSVDTPAPTVMPKDIPNVIPANSVDSSFMTNIVNDALQQVIAPALESLNPYVMKNPPGMMIGGKFSKYGI